MDEQNSVLEREVLGQGIFVGTYEHSLDPKKRLTIPSEWRAQVGEPKGLYVLPDIHERCLRVFPASAMLQRMGRMREHSIADRVARRFARVLASQADLVSWDVQGRIRVKDPLLRFANLVDQVTLVAAFDTFELWNPDVLREAGDMDPAHIREAAEYVGL